MDNIELDKRITDLESKSIQLKLQPTEQENLKNNIFDGVTTDIPTTAVATNLEMTWKKDKYYIPTKTEVDSLISTAISAIPSSGVTYAGIVTGFAGGIAPATNLPTGWSSGSSGTGIYTVTHNLGTTNYSIVATTYKILSFFGLCYITAHDANSFSVETYANGGLNNMGFSFNLTTL